MNRRAWRAEWSSEIEQAWAVGVSVGADARASIRPEGRHTVATGNHRTRPLDEDERLQLQPFSTPSSATRLIRVTDLGQPQRSDAPAELELLEQVGAGGMGVVFRARQRSLDREVAVKRLTRQENLPDAAAHFESEACVTAVLDHPNVVPVHDMGIDEHGNVFYSMKMIDGTPWDELLVRRSPGSVEPPPGDPRDLRAHLEILLEVAHAVAFAHSRGIIHRDIKPQNVMVGDYGEVLLVDWGLAVSLHPVDHPGHIFDLAQVLVTCGTPAYMPPEISTGQRDWIGPWTDVYMLGAVLFEVLYGLPPHDQSTAIDALKVASRNEWNFPEFVGPALQPYHDVLEPVLRQALATHPEQRHPDGAAFAEAVREALRRLDSAQLASEAIADFRTLEAEEALAQHARRAGRSMLVSSTQARYRTITRVIAVLEQALARWPGNMAARHHLVEGHLLHAHISLLADDLALAETHLQGLEQLPANIELDEPQARRCLVLQQRLQTQHTTRVRRHRWMLTLQVSAAVLTLALLVGAAVATWLIGSARDRARLERNHLSRLLIGTASDGVEADLERLFAPVHGTLRAAADWASTGALDSDDPKDLTALLRPLVEGYPLVSGVVRADARGSEYLLLRTEDGWNTRVTTPGAPSQFARLRSDGQVLETWTEQLDYDPHTRPWYGGALGQTPGEVFWTEPYTFYTSRQPGITASIAARSPSGRRFVLGVDLSLADISAFTMNMPDSEHGKVFVLTEDDRVIGLPRSPTFDGEAMSSALLQPLTALGEPVPTRALEQWSDSGRATDRPFRFITEGQAWWSGFRPFALGPSVQLWIGVVLPEADFDVPEPE